MLYDISSVYYRIISMIGDNNDNDVVFVIGQKGSKKTEILNSVKSNLSSNYYISSGDMVLERTDSFIVRCFLELLEKYTASNRKMTRKLKKILKHEFDIPPKVINQGKDTLYNYMSENLGVYSVKKALIRIAGNIPFIVLANAVDLQQKDYDYLSSLSSEHINARITYIIIIQPNERNNAYIEKLVANSGNIELFPIIPFFNDDSLYRIWSNFTKQIPYNNLAFLSFQDMVFSSNNIIKAQLQSLNKMDYRLLPALAYLEISKEDYNVLDSISNSIFRNNRIYLSSQFYVKTNKSYLISDSVFYYLFMNNNIERILNETQRFFFKLYVNYSSELYEEGFLQIDERQYVFFNLDDKRGNTNHNYHYTSIYDKISSNMQQQRSSFYYQIHCIIQLLNHNKEENILFNEYNQYYHDFSHLILNMIRRSHKRNQSNHETIKQIINRIDVLFRYKLKYSTECLQTLIVIHYLSGLDCVLEEGLKSIEDFLSTDAILFGLTMFDKRVIKAFCDYSNRISKKHYNESIIGLLAQIHKFTNQYSEERKKYLLCHSESKNTIFLSHASKDKETIVDELYKSLSRIINVWYDGEQSQICKPIKEIIMEGVVNSKYAVIVISKSFFDSDWCEQEIKSLLMRQNDDGDYMVIPVLHNITIEELKEKYPSLCDYGIKPLYTDSGCQDITISVAGHIMNKLFDAF